MIKAIKFATVPVTDQDRALAFYTEKLGFRILTDQQFDDKQRWIELSIPGAETGVVLFTPDGHQDRIGTFSAISFQCDDVQRTYDELSARGVEFTGPADQTALGNLCDLQGPRREPVRDVGQVGDGAATLVACEFEGTRYHAYARPSPIALLPAPPAFAQKADAVLHGALVAPNRAEIAFVSGGDIWTAPLAGGEAHLLVSHPANETRPMYSPDGTRLAFVSNRTGNGDLYVLNLATGALQRITFDDAAEQLDGWSRDGKYLYFSSTAQEVGEHERHLPHQRRGRHAGGGQRGPRTSTSSSRRLRRTGSRSPSRRAAIRRASGGGTATATSTNPRSGWRPSAAAPKYEKLAGGDFKCLWPMWSGDGARVYYHERSGRRGEPLGEEPSSGGAPKQVTQFHDGRVLWPSISYDGKTIVFERDFGIWKLDTATGKAAPIEITRRGATGTPEVTHLSLTNQFRDLVLAPDGRKLAFTAHGEVFAAAAREGGPAARVTRTTGNENQIAWSPDSRRMVYVSDRDGAYHLYLYDFASSTETRLTSDAGAETAPVWSGDGKLLGFVRDGKQLCVYDVAAKQVRTLASGRFPRPPFGSNRFYAWSPDNQWIAYFTTGDRSFENVFVVPAAGGDAAPDQLPRQYQRRHACSGRPTEPTFCSTPTSGPRTTTSRASIWS